MKKLFNILLAVIITIVCAFSLTACSVEDGNPTNKTGLIISKDKNGTYVVRDFVYVDGALDNGTLDIGAILSQRNISSAKISAGAFDGDDKIKTLIVSDKIFEIEQGAFRNMKSLETLEVPFVGKNAKTDAEFNQTLEAEGKSVNMARTFSHFFGTVEYEEGRKMNNGFSDVYVPYTLRNVIVNATANVDYTVQGKKAGYAIGYTAFKDARFLQNITLKGENLKEIGKEAFSGCTGLRVVNLPNTIETIYASAFSGCENLAEVVFAGTNVKLKENVFNGCVLMNKINSQANLTIDLACFAEIGIGAFDFDREVKYNVLNKGTFNLQDIFSDTEFQA